MAGKESGIIPRYSEFGGRRIQSECGMFASFYPGHDVRVFTYDAGGDLQHRAEGGAGMFVSDGKNSDIVRGLGRISTVFQEGKFLPDVEGHIALIHNRYPTAGNSDYLPNIQPLSLDGLTLGHHGNLTNATEILNKLGNVQRGGEFPDSDSWLALNAIVRTPGDSLAEKLIKAQKDFEGGWAFILTDGKQIVASRDPQGIRPLFIADRDNGSAGHFLSVETAPFVSLGVDNYREVLPGETLVIDEKGVRTVDVNSKDQRSCIFEFVYMMNPVSEFMGQNVYMTRRRAGEILWEEQPVIPEKGEQYVVMGIPDSGRASALGFFQRAQEEYGNQFTYDEGLIAKKYFGRRFIKSSQERANTSKFNAIDELITGKSIIIVDDSIVRGETNKDNVKKLLERGARRVYGRVASPEITHPCFWGVAFSTEKELFANNFPDIEDRARRLNLVSLGHLSMEGLFKSVGMSSSEIKAAIEKKERKFCTHCFDGFGPDIKNHGIIPLVETQEVPA